MCGAQPQGREVPGQQAHLGFTHQKECQPLGTAHQKTQGQSHLLTESIQTKNRSPQQPRWSPPQLYRRAPLVTHEGKQGKIVDFCPVLQGEGQRKREVVGVVIWWEQRCEHK